jgi:hypothetical protein
MEKEMESVRFDSLTITAPEEGSILDSSVYVQTMNKIIKERSENTYIDFDTDSRTFEKLFDIMMLYLKSRTFPITPTKNTKWIFDCANPVNDVSENIENYSPTAVYFGPKDLNGSEKVFIFQEENSNLPDEFPLNESFAIYYGNVCPIHRVRNGYGLQHYSSGSVFNGLWDYAEISNGNLFVPVKKTDYCLYQGGFSTKYYNNYKYPCFDGEGIVANNDGYDMGLFREGVCIKKIFRSVAK